MNRKKILLLFGGESSEHDVSVASARNVYAAMDNSKYEIFLGFIDTHGKWWLLEEWSDQPQHHGGVQLVAALGTGSFVTIPQTQIIHPDVIFPILHGKNGEDGTVQGLADMLHVPIVGCNVEASAVCMDKDLTKRILKAKGIAVVDWLQFKKYDDVEKKLRLIRSKLEEKVGIGPWFVKPSRAGSSVGVSKVTRYEDLQAAIQETFKYDDTALVEKTVVGRELEVAVLGTPPHHKVSGVGEIIPGDEFYSYDDKYAQESTSQTILRADLPDELRKTIQDKALKTYALLGCSGLARIDFLLDGDNVPYVNEVNTLPGFTSISMYPKLWQQEGIKYPDLISTLIADALQRATIN